MEVLLLSLAAAAPPQAPRPPQAPPVQVTADPYNLFTYDRLYEHVGRGMPAVLFVGVKDTAVGTYQSHLWVPSGFKGLPDGVYDCHGENGKAVMRRRDTRPAARVQPAMGVPAVVPFPPEASPPFTTLATTVPHAAGASFWFPGPTPTAVITTGAPHAGRFGTTSDCRT